MNGILGLLQEVEKLAYKVLIWIILIPKTIVKIVLSPGWASEYVKRELRQQENTFDEYISPVILLLVVAFIPALFVNLLPTYGLSIISPADGLFTTERTLSIEIKADFKSANLFNEFTMSILKQDEAVKLGDLTNYNYTESHDDYDDGTDSKDEKTSFIYEGQRTVYDVFSYDFSNLEPGTYGVDIVARNFNVEHPDKAVERYRSYILITIPKTPEESISIVNASQRGKQSNPVNENGNPSSPVSDEKAIFLALALMTPPMLISLFKKIENKQAVSETTMRSDFYVQCYYFSPLALAIWSRIYANRFYTADAFYYRENLDTLLFIDLPVLIAFVWFIGVEITEFSHEKATSKWKALWILIAFFEIICFVLLLVSLASFSGYLQDELRKWAIRALPLSTVALVLAFLIRRMRSWLEVKKQRKKRSQKVE